MGAGRMDMGRKVGGKGEERGAGGGGWDARGGGGLLAPFNRPLPEFELVLNWN